MSKRIKICIKKDHEIYQTTSLYFMSDGSFKIDVPYCYYDEGLLIKFPVDYSKRDYALPVDETRQKFKAENRPQLSIHASGFVQFSGTKIVSGIDPETGNPKGIGIFCSPLITPIVSGPTMGCLIWGINHYQKIDSINDECLVISDADFINRIYRDAKKRGVERTILNTYTLEFFVFPEEYSKLIFPTSGGEMMTFRFWNYYECPGSIFTFPVVRLKNHSSFLGILPFKTYSGWPSKSAYGFHLGSPSGTDTKNEKGCLYSIVLMYPNNMLTDEDIDASLDRK